MKLTSFIFSPCGSTAALAKAAVSALGIAELTEIDLCNSDNRRVSYQPGYEEAVMFACPVYFAHIPAPFAHAIKNITAAGNPAIVILNSYGNTDNAPLLQQLCAQLSSQGFSVIAAECFFSRHAVLSPISAKHRADTDLTAASRFAADTAKKLAAPLQPLGFVNKKTRPAQFAPAFEIAVSDSCTGCGKCALECPVNAINPAFPTKTDSLRCISCARCIHICPSKARHFTGEQYAAYTALTALMPEK